MRQTNGRTLRLLVAVTLVAAIGSPAVAAYRVGPEIAASTPLSRTIDASSATTMAVTFDGSQYVAFWNETRGVRREVFAARFVGNGGVIDRFAVPVASGPVSFTAPKAVWTGSRHLLMVTSDDPTEAPTTYLASFATDGTVVQGATQLGIKGYSGLALAVAGDRVFAFRSTAGEVRVDVLDSTAVLKGSVPVSIGTGALTAAGSASQVLAVWTEAGGTRAVRLDRDGKVVGSVIDVATTRDTYPAVASDGDGFLIVWREAAALMARRVSASGVASQPMLVSTISDAASGVASVTWSEGRYSIAFRRGSSLVVAKIDASDRTDIQAVSSSDFSAYAVAGAPTWAIWNEATEGGRRIVARPTDSSIVPVPVAMGGARQRMPQLAAPWVGSGFDVTWAESAESEWSSSLVTLRLRSAGASDPRVLVTPPAGERVEGGRAVPILRASLLAWSENYPCGSQICGRVKAQLAGPPPVAVTGGSLSEAPAAGAVPDVAPGADTFLVSWRTAAGVTGTVVDDGGAVRGSFKFDAPAVGTDQSRAIAGPRAIWGGDRFLVVWSVITIQVTPQKGEIYGAFVQQDGTASQPFLIESQLGTDAAIASNGSEFLIAWTALQRQAGDSPDLYATSVTNAGQVRTRRLVATGGNRKTEPRAIFAERGWVVTWLESETAAARAEWLRGARISESEPVTVRPFDVLRLPNGFRQQHALALSGTGEVGVAYTRPDASAGGMERVFVRFLEPLPPTPRIRSVRH